MPPGRKAEGKNMSDYNSEYVSGTLGTAGSQAMSGNVIGAAGSLLVGAYNFITGNKGAQAKKDREDKIAGFLPFLQYYDNFVNAILSDPVMLGAKMPPPYRWINNMYAIIAYYRQTAADIRTSSYSLEDRCGWIDSLMGLPVRSGAALPQYASAGGCLKVINDSWVMIANKAKSGAYNMSIAGANASGGYADDGGVGILTPETRYWYKTGQLVTADEFNRLKDLDNVPAGGAGGAGGAGIKRQ